MAPVQRTRSGRWVRVQGGAHFATKLISMLMPVLSPCGWGDAQGLRERGPGQAGARVKGSTSASCSTGESCPSQALSRDSGRPHREAVVGRGFCSCLWDSPAACWWPVLGFGLAPSRAWDSAREQVMGRAGLGLDSRELPALGCAAVPGQEG